MSSTAPVECQASAAAELPKPLLPLCSRSKDGSEDASPSHLSRADGSPSAGSNTSGRDWRRVDDLPDLTERIQSMGLYEEYQRFRNGYLSWRSQGHRGARGEHTAEHLQETTTAIARGKAQFQRWYPTYKSWMYRRTMSYWIVVSFTEGSWLFVLTSVVGCVPSLMDKPYVKALTSWPALMGGSLFTIGSYMMCLETVKIFEPNRTSSWWPFTRKRVVFPEDPEVSRWPYITSLAYFLGTLFYLPAMVTALFHYVSPALELVLITLPLSVGGLLFFVGGIGEFMEQRCYDFSSCWRLSQASALGNFVGGFLFFLGGAVLFFPDMYFTSSLVFTIGSALYTIDSIAGIWLWRDEQFGLTYLSALNDFGPRKHGSQDPLPKFSWRGFMFINCYCFIFALGTCNACLEFHHFKQSPSFFSASRAINEVLPLALVFGVEVVHSAVVETPKVQPWHMLIMGIRWLALAVGANTVLSYCLWVIPEDYRGRGDMY